MKRTILSAIILATATLALSGCNALEVKAPDIDKILSANISEATIVSAGSHTVAISGFVPFDTVNVILPAVKSGKLHFEGGGVGTNKVVDGAQVTGAFTTNVVAEDIAPGTYQIKIVGKGGYPKHAETSVNVSLNVK